MTLTNSLFLLSATTMVSSVASFHTFYPRIFNTFACAGAGAGAAGISSSKILHHSPHLKQTQRFPSYRQPSMLFSNNAEANGGPLVNERTTSSFTSSSSNTNTNTVNITFETASNQRTIQAQKGEILRTAMLRQGGHCKSSQWKIQAH